MKKIESFTGICLKRWYSSKIGKIMRLSFFLFLIGTLNLIASNSYSQKTRMSLSIKQTSVKDVLKQIERESEFYFLYNNKLIDVDRKVDLDIKNEKIKDILLEIFSGTEVQFLVMDRQIVLTPKNIKQKADKNNSLFLQNLTVSGTVVDESGKPIPGVTVLIKGTNQGTITSEGGQYSLSTPADAVLVFSFIGMKTQEIVVAGKTTLNVTLQQEVIGLDEVVTIGYGTKKKVNSTGSISTITSKELAQTSVTNLNDAIVGQTSGIVAVTPDGSPGSGAQIQIRGMGTLQNNTVLVLVDGVIRDFSQLDPNEIESISILKDGASAAIYGVKGGNGVILVTTKRGNMGRPKFSFNSQTSFQSVTRYPDLLNSYQYATTSNQGYINMGLDPDDPANQGKFFTPEEINKFKSGEINTQFYDLLFDLPATKNHQNLSISGGSDKIRYFFSGGYLNQNGLIPNSSFTRNNLRSNVDATITPYFSIQVDLDGRIEDKDSPSYGESTIFQHMVRANPTLRAYDINGVPLYITGPQPLEEARQGGVNNWRTLVMNAKFNALLKFDFIEALQGLSARFSYAYGETHINNKYFRKPYIVYRDDNNDGIAEDETVSSGGATELREISTMNYGYTLDAGLNYDRTFGDHKVSALFVYEQRESSGKYLEGYRQGFISDIIPELFAGDPETATNNGFSNELGYLSYIGRLTYIFKNKYIAEFSARNDASVLFPPATRWGFFPSYSLGWRLSEERFIKNNVNFIDNLKIRASYGNLGTDAGAGQYSYLDQYRLSYGALIDNQITTGLSKKVEPNKDITWEKVSTYDIGLEGILWKGLLGFDVAYFKKITSDILAPKIISTPMTFGATLPPVNYAEVELKGWEFTISHVNTIGNFKYNVNVNFTKSENEVLEIDDPKDQLEHLVRKGKPLDFYVGYKTDGLFQSDEEAQNYYPQFGNNQVGAGDIKYVDRNGDKIIDENDLDVISLDSYMPKIMYGLNFSCQWKKFDMNFMFQGAAKRKIMLGGPARVMFTIGENNFYEFLTDSWSPDNKDAEFPRAWRGNNINNDRDSEFWLRDGSYLRLKTLELGYNFSHLLKGVENLRLFVSGFNVFTIDKLKYFDPEVGNGTGTYNVNANAQRNYTTWGTYYPQQKSFNIGVNLTF
jgi:TonB-linked SusC/RagA family outer membrane protein